VAKVSCSIPIEGVGVTKKTDHFVKEISAFVEMTERLRETLARYKRANSNLARRVARGESVLEAFDAMDGAMDRQRELTEMLDEFEEARHRVRLALFELARAQGATVSELGRRLGISRQLASRLATEATAEADP